VKTDLHLHTTASDGRYTPDELVSHAVKAGLNVIAISDHDTVAGIVPALEAARKYSSLIVIPAVEINCDVADGEVHVLGYFLDCNDLRLNTELSRLRDSRVARGAKMVAKLRALGMDVKWERVQEIAGTGSVGRPHVAQALVEAGCVPTIRDAFTLYIGRHGPAYVEREKITPAGAVQLVAAAGGLPVLAHPGDIAGLDILVHELTAVGLVGIEVYYNGYVADTISRLLAIAKRHNLAPTGGSDFHGLDSDSIQLGTLDVPPQVAQRLFELAGRSADLARILPVVR
jgi:predicted metal-dependent phosphoesterase TrpH